MNLRNHLSMLIKNKLREIPEVAPFLDDYGHLIVVEVPKNRSFGDFALNVAMVLARPMKRSPASIATLVLEKIAELPEIATASVAGAGFINMTLADSVWDSLLSCVLDDDNLYGTSEIGKKEKINVEFLSANPTGPLHIGHARGAIYGDVLARLLAKVGFDVTREYYVNDYGQQINVLAQSLYWRYEEIFGLHQNDEFPKASYPGEYLIEVAKSIADKDGNRWLTESESVKTEYFKTVAVEQMLSLIKKTLHKMNIYFDKYVSERELVESNKVSDIITKMQAKDLLYKGVLAKPLGEEVEDWSPEEQLLFRATDFGDDFDRVIARADGKTTYFASDIAYHLYKFERGFEKQIDVWGADHGGYVTRIKSAMKAVTDGRVDLEVLLCQIVNLEKDGKPFKMSKRAGNFVMIEDVLDEVEPDSLRLLILTKSADSQMTFDLAKVKERSKTNPVFYIQYAHARSCSLLRKYKETFMKDFAIDSALLEKSYNKASDAEKSIVKLIADYPSIVESAAVLRSPHLLTGYLETLAGAFHSLWTLGAKSEYRFIVPDSEETSKQRMLIVMAVNKVIADGLKTLGITPKESMTMFE